MVYVTGGNQTSMVYMGSFQDIPTNVIDVNSNNKAHFNYEVYHKSICHRKVNIIHLRI